MHDQWMQEGQAFVAYFSMSSRDLFNHAILWTDTIVRANDCNSKKEASIMLICDTLHHNLFDVHVTEDEIKNVANEMDGIYYIINSK